MNNPFKGFQNKEITSPRANRLDVASNSDVSSDDSQQESQETTPDRNFSSGNISAVKNKDQGPGVRRLIEHFSHSDSDTADTDNRTTRRRKSKSSEHQELPRGGERELRKNMAQQTQANNSLRIWEALITDLRTELQEIQQALDTNKKKEVLLGLLEGMEEIAENSWNYYEELMAYQQVKEVNLQYVDITIAKNKLKSQVRKAAGHIKALAEADSSDKDKGNNVVQIVSPQGFGDLDLPDFYGDFTEFESFEANFKKLIENGDLDDGKKSAHLLKSLKGEAKDYIGTDGTAAKTYEEIWIELRQRYGKKWRITRAAVKKFLDIPDPKNDSKDVVRYWNQVIDACKTADRIKLTASSIILNTALLKLPAEYRGKMDEKLRAVSDDYILTRAQVAEPFNDVIAIELEKPNQIVSTLGFNTSVGMANNQQNKKKQKGNKGYKSFCLLCQVKSNHQAASCPVYQRGQQARGRIMALGRCANCATLYDEHGPLCSHRAVCSVHPNQRHHYWLCDAGGNRGSLNHLASKSQQPQQNHGQPLQTPQYWPKGSNQRQQGQAQPAHGYIQLGQGYAQPQHGQNPQNNVGAK